MQLCRCRYWYYDSLITEGDRSDCLDSGLTGKIEKSAEITHLKMNQSNVAKLCETIDLVSSEVNKFLLFYQPFSQY